MRRAVAGRAPSQPLPAVPSASPFSNPSQPPNLLHTTLLQGSLLCWGS